MYSGIAPERRFASAALCTCVCLGAVMLLKGVPAMSDPEFEYLSDVFSERALHYTIGWGLLGIDTCVRPAGRDASPMRIKDKPYTKGIGHHATGEMLIDLSGEYSTFEAEIGVQWQKGETGSVVFQVYVDEVEVFDSGVVREQDAPRPIRIDLTDADEMRLVSSDAGDGIACDCANWAEARLIKNPNAGDGRPREMFDAAPYARVVTTDPRRADGCKSKRTQEYRPEDVYLATDIVPDDQGHYTVPTVEGGQGSIGLLWVERRLLKELVIEFARGTPLPDPQTARVEYWSGESRWQGKWEPVDGEIGLHERAPRRSAGCSRPRRRRSRWLGCGPSTVRAGTRRGCGYSLRSPWSDKRAGLRSTTGPSARPKMGNRSCAGPGTCRRRLRWTCATRGRAA